MRIIISLILFLSSFITIAQSKPLFKIISCSEGVMLDGVEVKPGQVVYSNSKGLKISRKGYVGIITVAGDAVKLTKSESISDILFSNNDDPIKNTGTVVIHDGPSVHEIYPDGMDILGDSIFIGLKDRDFVGPPYLFDRHNVYGEYLLTDTLTKNWNVWSIADLIPNDKKLLYNIRGMNEKVANDSFAGVRKAEDNKKVRKLQLDISRLDINDWISRAAVFELEGFFYDHIFCLYKVASTNSEVDPSSMNYFLKQKEKYNFNKFDFELTHN